MPTPERNSNLSTRAVLLALSLGLTLFLAACGSSGTQPANPGPQVPTGAVQNVCSTANASLNPDPGKDLTFVVQDAKGDPIANQSITIGFYKNDGSYVGIYWGQTAPNGTFSMDTTVSTWLAATPLSAFVAVSGTAATPGLATACGNVDGPGTFTVSTGDAGLAAVTFDLHSGSAATTTPYVFPAFVFHGEARETNSLFAGDTKQVMMLPGSYDLGMFTVWNGATYVLYQDTTVSGDSTVSLDVTSVPTAQLHAAIQGTNAGQAMSQPGFTLFRADPAIDMRWGSTSGLPDIDVTPGTYGVRAWGSLTDSQSVDWQYTFEDPQFHVALAGLDLTTAGSSLSYTFGGALNASLSADAASYAAGATVTLTPSASDPAGNVLTHVYRQTSPNWTAFGPSIQVKDPGGNVVYANALDYSFPAIFQLSGTAPTGTYTATLTWDVGPYRSAPLTASTTFQVQ